jgi:hypothetical protein
MRHVSSHLGTLAHSGDERVVIDAQLQCEIAWKMYGVGC